MLMNTYAFGAYDGPEEVLATPDGYTNINVTTNYAPVDTIGVSVVDAEGRPVPGAKVSFRLYNYGEFYPIATKTADSGGHASLSGGIGDVVVWATDGKKFGIAKGSVGRDRHPTSLLMSLRSRRLKTSVAKCMRTLSAARTPPHSSPANAVRNSVAVSDSIRPA